MNAIVTDSESSRIIVKNPQTEKTETPDFKVETPVIQRPSFTILRETDSWIQNEYKKIPSIFYPSDSLKLPIDFDGRTIWKGLLTPVMEQGKCGSCWAFASTSVLADRFNIHSVGQMHIRLSPTKLIICDWKGKELEVNPEGNSTNISYINSDILNNAACFGNTLFDAWRYLYLIGTASLECLPYDSNLGVAGDYQRIGAFSTVAELPMCQDITGVIGDMCAGFNYDSIIGEESGVPQKFYSAFVFYTVPGTPADGATEANIRQEIFRWGPISTAMKVYEDYFTYDGIGIYEWNGQGEQIGGHAIELTGWGTTDGVDWWQVKNSWGTEWGDKGYYKMKRGTNTCGIEANAVAGFPSFFYPLNYSLDLPNIPSKLKEQKMLIQNRLGMTGGGIDPETGYTRRAMMVYPWLNVSRPVELDDLPNWNKFIAGIDCAPQERIKYLSKIRAKNTQFIRGFWRASFIILAMSLLLIAIIYLLYKRSDKNK